MKIPPIYNEDYERFYGKVDYKGKTVLDIGADYGSTADFFLEKGASHVIAVEPIPELFYQLQDNIRKFGLSVTPIFIRIHSEDCISELIEEYKPQIVKADCEGCEKFFLDVSDEVFSIPEAYVVETHDQLFMISKPLIEKLERNGFKIICVDNWVGDVSVVTATRNI